MKRLYLSLIGVLFLSACSKVSYEKEFSRIKERARHALDADIVVENAAHLVSVRLEVEDRLQQGLTREQAVGLALQNNAELQRDFEDLGVAKSDLRDVGLYSNPQSETIFALQNAGGRVDIQTGVTFNVADLWMVPLRKKISRKKLEVISMRIYQAILDTKLKTERAYDACHFGRRKLNKVEQSVAISRKAYEQITIRKEHGLSNDLQILSMFVLSGRLDIRVRELKTTLAQAYLDLRTHIGATPTPEPVLLIPNDYDKAMLQFKLPLFDDMLERALSQRPELQMAQLTVEQLKRSLPLEKAQPFKNVQLGLYAERQQDGGNQIGPMIGIDIPLFQFGQYKHERVRHLVNQAQKVVEIEKRNVRRDLHSAFVAIKQMQENVREYKEQIVPAGKKAVLLVKGNHGAMQVSIFEVFQAQIQLFQSQESFIDTYQQLAMNMSLLERAVGGQVFSGGGRQELSCSR